MLPSEYVPIAISATVPPIEIVLSAGTMVIDFNAAEVTVRVLEPMTFPSDAVITVVPAVKVLATPPAEIVATFGAEELQVTLFVMSAELPSE
jgi:hypothetical protein